MVQWPPRFTAVSFSTVKPQPELPVLPTTRPAPDQRTKRCDRYGKVGGAVPRGHRGGPCVCILGTQSTPIQFMNTRVIM